MRVYAVIDTNVLVSALLRYGSVPGQVMAQALTGQLIPLLNDEILAEYAEVLARPKFHFPTPAVAALLEGLIRRGLFVDAGPVDELLPDPDDAVFYAVTMEARKDRDAYLVTGNLKHFPLRPYVVTPHEMLEILHGADAARNTF